MEELRGVRRFPRLCIQALRAYLILLLTVTVSLPFQRDVSRLSWVLDSPNSGGAVIWSAEAYYDTLQSFFQSTAGPTDWIDTTGWGTNDTDYCTWTGIICDFMDPTIIMAIFLPSNGLTGALPILDIPALKALDLSDNALYGSIPEGFTAAFPNLELLLLGFNKFESTFDSLLPMPGLQFLSIVNNPISGSIPSNIDTLLPQLQKIDIGSTLIAGNIPDSVWRLPSLEELRVGASLLSGPITEAIISAKDTLTVLDLSFCSFSGPLPSNMDALTNLQTLNLRRSGLTFSINQLTTMKWLVGLDVSQNNLREEISSNISELQSLTSLDAMGNQLTGSFPEAIGKMIQLTHLDLSSNNLTGSIPEVFQNLTGLSTLVLGDNQFTGAIPVSLGSCSGLQWLDLHNNNLENPIPCQLNATSLNSLYLHNNRFSGPVPSCLAGLTRLRNFRINKNFMTGTVPQSFKAMKLLLTLYLGNNKFTSIDDGALAAMTYLSRLDMTDNQFTTFPMEACGLKRLREIYLDNNQITSLPSCIGNMAALQILSIPNNQLAGEIPSSIGDLSLTLQIISASNNSISGALPSTMSKLTNLILLRLDHNKLQGSILEVLPRLQKLKIVDLSSNMLSGPLESDTLPLTLPQLAVLNISQNQFTGPFPSKLFVPCSPQLVLIDASYNKLDRFTLSADATACGQLQGIFMQYNQIQLLEILGNLVDWTSLTQIDFSHNKITNIDLLGEKLLERDQALEIGRLGAFVTTPQGAVYRSDYFSLQLLAQITKNQIMNTIELSNNQISTFPESFLHFRVYNLFLQNNNLQKLPSTIAYDVTIDTVLLATGDVLPVVAPFPPFFYGSSSHTNVNFSSNQLSGDIPSYLVRFQSSKTLDFSNNSGLVYSSDNTFIHFDSQSKTLFPEKHMKCSKIFGRNVGQATVNVDLLTYKFDQCECVAEYYGPIMETCVSCPEFSKCLGGDAGTPILVQQGYYANQSEPNGRYALFLMPLEYSCATDSTYSSGDKGLYCSTESQCVSGREGFMCGKCLRGYSQAFAQPQCVPDENCFTSSTLSGLFLLLALSQTTFISSVVWASVRQANPSAAHDRKVSGSNDQLSPSRQRTDAINLPSPRMGTGTSPGARRKVDSLGDRPVGQRFSALATNGISIGNQPDSAAPSTTSPHTEVLASSPSPATSPHRAGPSLSLDPSSSVASQDTNLPEVEAPDSITSIISAYTKKQSPSKTSSNAARFPNEVNVSRGPATAVVPKELASSPRSVKRSNSAYSSDNISLISGNDVTLLSHFYQVFSFYYGNDVLPQDVTSLGVFTYIRDVMNTFLTANVGFLKTNSTSSTSWCLTVGMDALTQAGLSLAYSCTPVVALFLILRAYDVFERCCIPRRWRTNKPTAGKRFRRTAVVLALELTFTAILTSAMTLVSCVRVSETSRVFFYDGTVECYTGGQLIGIAVMSLMAIYPAGVLGFLLVQARKPFPPADDDSSLERQQADSPTRAKNKGARRSILYREFTYPYLPERFYWPVIYYLQPLCNAFIKAFASSSVSKTIGYAFVSILLVISRSFLSVREPFINPLNSLEDRLYQIVLLTASVLTLSEILLVTNSRLYAITTVNINGTFAIDYMSIIRAVENLRAVTFMFPVGYVLTKVIAHILYVKNHKNQAGVAPTTFPPTAPTTREEQGPK